MGIQYDYILNEKINQLIKSSTNKVLKKGMHFKELLQRENTILTIIPIKTQVSMSVRVS